MSIAGPSGAPQAGCLVCREPRLRRDGWVKGATYRTERWPGHRALRALKPDEPAPLGAWRLAQTGRRKISPTPATAGQLKHKGIPVVAPHEARVAPHTDSRQRCTYAAVLDLPPCRADLIHGSTACFGAAWPDRRMAAVFFWMAK